MQTFWKKTAVPLASHADWMQRLEKKNRRQGTSAPTLAAAWSGPIEVLGALQHIPRFADVLLEEVVVEGGSRFDAYGGPRNHDLVVRGRLPDGERVVICIEAKAGENFGQTVEQYARAARTKRRSRKRTDAPERLRDLLAKYLPHMSPTDEPVRRMRYQLLSALAGTEAEANATKADHAVMMVHEFLTDRRPEDKSRQLLADLHRLITGIVECRPPDADPTPWCFELPVPASTKPKLYVAWAVTDLRTTTLQAG